MVRSLIHVTDIWLFVLKLVKLLVLIRLGGQETGIHPLKPLWENSLFVNPITYGGGGGLFGLDHQIIDLNSKTGLSGASKLADFLLSIRHILAEF